MTFWLTSDYHLWHANVLGLCGRPFADVYEMNDTIVSRHNRLVSDSDTVIDLGDFSWQAQTVRRDLAMFKGKRHLIAGNHDRCSIVHRKHERERRRYLAAGFASVNDRVMLNVRGRRVLLCHFPSAADSTTELRYSEHRPRPTEFDRLIHGHVHGARRFSADGREANVGVDVRSFWPVRSNILAGELGLDPAAFDAALAEAFP